MVSLRVFLTFIWLLFTINLTIAQSFPLAGQIDAFLYEQVERHNLTGLTVVIVDREGLVYQAGIGDVTPTSLLPIASLSKAFTATAVMQQVEAGRINLDAPVQRYLPWFDLEHITIRQLLNHSSGLGDAGYPPSNFSVETTLETAIRDLVRTAQPVSRSGSTYHYFNPNYQVLGLIVEQVTGQPFNVYLQTHIFTPLQMHDTSTIPPLRPDHLLSGHLTVFGLPIAASETVYGEYGIPSGGIVSTANDMGHFLRMQLNAGVFDQTTIVLPESITLMHTPPTDFDTHYAMGWKTSQSDDMPLLEHGGDLTTYHAQMILLPEQELGIVLLLNQNGFLHNFTSYVELNQGIVSMLTNQDPPRGMSLKTLGLSLLAAALITISLGIWSLMRLWHFRYHWCKRPWWWILFSSMFDLLPLGVFIASPYLIWLLLGRFASYDLLFVLQPDIMLWLSVIAVFGIISVGIKCWAKVTGCP